MILNFFFAKTVVDTKAVFFKILRDDNFTTDEKVIVRKINFYNEILTTKKKSFPLHAQNVIYNNDKKVNIFQQPLLHSRILCR